MNLTELLRKLANDRNSQGSFSYAEVVAALNKSFPEGRNSSRRAEDVGRPPVIVKDIEWKRGAYYPKNEPQVQELVIKARDTGHLVRVAGAGHSTPEAVYSAESGDFRLVLDGSLRDVSFVSKDSSGAVIWAGGGCNLGVNPSDRDSRPENSLNAILDNAGYALPMLGGITHQTVAGFLQTSSAGGSLDHGIADAIAAIRLVDGQGRTCIFHRGSPEFEAAGVAMGLLGIVTAVKFEVKPRFFVRGSETNHEEADSWLARRSEGYVLEDVLQRTEFLHLNWYPQTGVHRVTQWEGFRTSPVPVPNPYDTELRSNLMNVLAAAVLGIIDGTLHVAPDSEAAQNLIATLLQGFLPLDQNETFNDAWHKVLPADDQVKVDSWIKIIFTEIWLPLDQLRPALDRLKIILEDPLVAGNFAVEFYGARQSPFWLSPSYCRNVVRVDVFWWANNIGDPRQRFAHFWEALLDLPGARLHWGKHLPDVGRRYGDIVFGPGFLDFQYPKLANWRILREQMDHNGVFLTEYWSRVLGR